MPPPRSKRLRAGEAYAQPSEANSSPNEVPSKKLRFDPRNPSNLLAEAADDEEDAILELDTIGKRGGAAKHSAVNLDGFDSDSDDDNFNVRAAERARMKKTAEKMANGGGAKNEDEDEDDDDMFAEEGEEEENEEGGDDPELEVKKKKTVQFMDESKIEGQVQSSTAATKAFDIRDSTGKTKEEDSDSESGGDEGRAEVGSDIDEELGAGSKKKHAPKMDAFNMRAEGEEGKFDETGNFVRQQDPNAIHDSWLEGVSKKEMKKARDAEEQRLQERRKKAREQDAILLSDLLATLISNLQVGETVLEALQRLAKGKPKPKPKWKRIKKNDDSMDVEDTPDEAEVKRKEAVDAITGAADTLMTRGHEEIYDTERELLMRNYKKETGEDWVDKRSREDESSDSDQWQFRWADARDGGILHGPYDTATVRSWVEAEYFGGDAEFQKVGENGWVNSVD